MICLNMILLFMALAQRKAEILSSMAYEYFILWTMLGWEFMSVFMFLRRWMANLYIIFKNGKKKLMTRAISFFIYKIHLC